MHDAQRRQVRWRGGVRRSVLVRMTSDGRKLETAHITTSPAALRRVIARAGSTRKVVLEATYGWYCAADTLAAAGAEVHLAQGGGAAEATSGTVRVPSRLRK